MNSNTHEPPVVGPRLVGEIVTKLKNGRELKTLQYEDDKWSDVLAEHVLKEKEALLVP